MLRRNYFFYLALLLVQVASYTSVDIDAKLLQDDLGPEPRYGIFWNLTGIRLPSRPPCSTAALCCKTLCATACNTAANPPGNMFCLGAPVGGVAPPMTGTACLVTPTPPACPACSTFSCPGQNPAGQPTTMMCTPPPANMMICPP